MALQLANPRRLAVGAAGAAAVNHFANRVFDQLIQRGPDAARAIARAGARAYRAYQDRNREPVHRQPYARRRQPVRNVDAPRSHSQGPSSSRTMSFRSRSRVRSSRRRFRRRRFGGRLRRINYRRSSLTVGRAPRRVKRRVRKAILRRVPPLAEIKMVGHSYEYYGGGAVYMPWRFWLDFPFYNVSQGTSDAQRIGKSIRGLGSTWKLAFFNTATDTSITVNIALIAPRKYAPAPSGSATTPFTWYLGQDAEADLPLANTSAIFQTAIGQEQQQCSHYLSNTIYFDKTRVKVISFQSFILAAASPSGPDARSASGISPSKKLILKQKYSPTNKVTWGDGEATGTPITASSMAMFFIWFTSPNIGAAQTAPVSPTLVHMQGSRRSWYVDS